MSNIFVTSDLHLFHKNILKFCPDSRPFEDINQMHSAIISNWNNVVDKEDEVYILGDVTFGRNEPTRQVLEKLNGAKHLILGNHDSCIKDSAKLRKCFDTVQNYVELKHLGVTICMFHYPILSWNGQNRNSIHLYGHLHGGGSPKGIEGFDLTKYGKCKDVGMDTNDCTPYLLEDVIMELK